MKTYRRRTSGLRVTVLLIALAVCSCGRTAPVEPAPTPRPHALIPLPVSAQFDAAVIFRSPATTIFVSPADEAVTRIGRFLADVIGASPDSNPTRRARRRFAACRSISLSLCRIITRRGRL